MKYAVPSLLGAFALRAAAQGAIASNATGYNASAYNGDLAIVTLRNPASTLYGYQIYPLTQNAYFRLPHGPKDTAPLNASVILDTPGTPQYMANLPSYALAYTSCDAQDYSGGNIPMAQVVQSAISANITGIVFYSRLANYCNLTDLAAYGAYQNMYTMISMGNSTSLLGLITGSFASNMAALYSGDAYYNSLSQSPFSQSGGSTAIAMIILYSITGVITALFLIIIITGAIRAHRHPERYGPRNVLGRARQSRAKGIARAMLDTIPIVKFGEQSEDGAKDVEGQPTTPSPAHELTDRTATPVVLPGPVSESEIASAATTSTDSSDGKKGFSDTTIETSQVASSSRDATNSTPTEDDAQGCSICTDDFERGQDIRVLPCGHQFHPACVDPWLLDVSGTCPLCRVDLHPQTAGAEDGDLPPPLAPDSGNAGPRTRRDTIRQFFARSSGSTALSGATREERIEALRSWREQNRAAAGRAAATTMAESRANAAAEAEGDGASGDDQGRSRLSRLSRLIRNK